MKKILSRKWLRFFYISVVLLSLNACRSFSTIELKDLHRSDRIVELNRALMEELEEFADSEGKLPLERILYHLGYRAVDTVAFLVPEEPAQSLNWRDVAELVSWLGDGRIEINEEILSPNEIHVLEHPLPQEARFQINDLANTILYSLSIPLLDAAESTPVTPLIAEHVVLIFWDGLGFLDAQRGMSEGLTPILAGLPAPYMGITAYPSTTSVATAAMITGLHPEKNGVEVAGIRTTASITIFDRMRSEGKEFTIIEGNSLYLTNLKDDNLVLVMDADLDGSNDDEIFRVAKGELIYDPPDFLWVHFHGLDDSGHTYSPWSQEYRESMARIDEYVGELIQASPSGTLFLIVADHGMNSGLEDQRSGEHGNLIVEDMIIPLFVVQKRVESNSS